MAFKKVEDKEKSSGLTMRWTALEDYECPRCFEDLVFFEHIPLWKCGCGFKIGNEKLLSIISNIDAGYYGRGFYLGKWHDETPF